VLADVTGGAPRLPRLSIPRWLRPAKQIQKEIERCWGLRVFILDTVESSSENGKIVLAELLFQFDGDEVLEKVKWLEPEMLLRNGLSEEESLSLNSFLHGGNEGPALSRLGWVHEALDWVGRQSSFTPHAEVCEVQQWNASSSAFLLRLSSHKGTDLWLKAVDPARSAECRITLTLASMFPGYLPAIISARDDWGAWIMEDGGPSAADDGVLETKAMRTMSRRLAELQSASIPHSQMLLDYGCTDWRLEHVRRRIVPTLPLLEEAMDAQDIHGLPQFGRRILEDLCEATEEACYRLNAIGIPDTLIHNDLQLENVIGGKAGCRFIDWDQAGIGNPFLAFEQLRVQLPESGIASLVSGYRSWWARILQPEAIDAGFALIPPIAIAVQLCRYAASIPAGATLRGLELRHLRSLTRQLDTALQTINRSKRRSA